MHRVKPQPLLDFTWVEPSPIAITSMPLQSACANCSLKLDKTKNSFVSPLSPGKIHQGLELVFKCHQIPLHEDKSNPINFCKPCGRLFEKMVNSFQDFLYVSSLGSYAQALWKFVAERVNEGEEFKPYDPQLFNGVQIQNEVNEADNHIQIVFDKILEVLPVGSEEELNIPTSEPSTSTVAPMPMKRSRKSNYNQLLMTYQEKPPPNVKAQKHKVEETKDPGLAEVVAATSAPAPGCDSGVGLPGGQEVTFQPLIRGRKDDLKSQVLGKRALPKDDDHPTEERRRNIHECLVCHEMFPTLDFLRTHKLTHTGDDPSRQNRILLTEEDKTLLLTSEYKCDDEGCAGELTFTSFKDWVLHHEWTHKMDTGYVNVESVDSLEPINHLVRPCPQCGKKYTSNLQVLSHLKQIHLRHQEYPCPICWKPFSTKNYMEAHGRVAHKTVPFPSTTTVPTRYKCSQPHCSTTFTKKSKLRYHENLHKFPCTRCDAKFRSTAGLTSHTTSKHPEDRHFKCDECQRPFKTAKTLRKHKRRLHVKKFDLGQICALCGEGFPFKEKLKEHLMRIHKMEKEEARVASGIQKPSLPATLPTGDKVRDEKPTKSNSCDICGEKYDRREELTVHMMTEHGQTEEEAKEDFKLSLVAERRSRGRCSRRSTRIAEKPTTFYST